MLRVVSASCLLGGLAGVRLFARTMRGRFFDEVSEECDDRAAAGIVAFLTGGVVCGLAAFLVARYL